MDPVSPGNRAAVGLKAVRDKLKQRGLAFAVPAHDAYALALVNANGLVGKHGLARPLVREVLAAYENPH